MRKSIVLALAAIAGMALACNRNVPDYTLDQTVMARLAKERALASTDLHVRSDGSHVLLTGHVQTPEQRKIAGEVADDVYGVNRVTNEIQIDAEEMASAPPSEPVPDEAREDLQ